MLTMCSAWCAPRCKSLLQPSMQLEEWVGDCKAGPCTHLWGCSSSRSWSYHTAWSFQGCLCSGTGADKTWSVLSSLAAYCVATGWTHLCRAQPCQTCLPGCFSLQFPLYRFCFGWVFWVFFYYYFCNVLSFCFSCNGQIFVWDIVLHSPLPASILPCPTEIRLVQN